MNDFTGKIALITGGGRGVGAEIGALLAKGGAHVILDYCRDAKQAETTLARILADGGSAELIRANVTDQDAVERLFTAVGEQHGRLDVLMNNAASGELSYLDGVTAKGLARAAATNWWGPLWCALQAAPLMPPGAAIVNISAHGAAFALPGYGGLGPSKAALESLTRYLAAELGPRRIRANAASGGILESEIASHLPNSPELFASISQLTPLGRLGTQRELAQVAVFLASSAASWINGQTVVVDGGLLTAPLPSPRPEPL